MSEKLLYGMDSPPYSKNDIKQKPSYTPTKEQLRLEKERETELYNMTKQYEHQRTISKLNEQFAKLIHSENDNLLKTYATENERVMKELQKQRVHFHDLMESYREQVSLDYKQEQEICAIGLEKNRISFIQELTDHINTIQFDLTACMRESGTAHMTELKSWFGADTKQYIDQMQSFNNELINQLNSEYAKSIKLFKNQCAQIEQQLNESFTRLSAITGKTKMLENGTLSTTKPLPIKKYIKQTDLPDHKQSKTILSQIYHATEDIYIDLINHQSQLEDHIIDIKKQLNKLT